MWDFWEKQGKALKDDKIIVEEKYHFYIMILLCFMYKKKKMTISRSKFQKIKKIAIQEKDYNIELFIYKEGKILLHPEKEKQSQTYLCELISSDNRRVLEKEMQSDLITRLEAQIIKYNMSE